jgi:protein gp37
MMSKSNIQWTDDTWNPTTGCTRVSAGCDHCYAFLSHDRRHIAWKRGWETAPAQYHLPFSRVQLLEDRLYGKLSPLRKRQPRRYFVDSMSDLFHEDVPDDYLRRVFEVMRQARRHTFQILTKRPERMRDWTRAHQPEPLPNVWLGTSVEDQAAADTRIPLLLDTPAAVRFLSCEPLLGPVDLDPWLSGLDWIILGGESGPHARAMATEWLDFLIAQCRQAPDIAVFVKQLGSVWKNANGAKHGHGGDPDEWPADLRIREFPHSALAEAS